VAEAPLLALLVLLPLFLDESAAQVRFDKIRLEFTQRPKEQSVAELVKLGDEAPDTQAGARALAWLGDLSHLQKEDAIAVGFYRRAYDSRAGGEGHRLGARGLGDVDMGTRDYGDAVDKYREAAAGATGVMATELGLKIELAKKLRRRALFEWAAWIGLLLLLVAYLVRARVWLKPVLEFPVEVVYVVPIYALLLAGCYGRDPSVLHALWIVALGSTALIAAAGLSMRREPALGLRRWGHVLLLAAANVALFYAACNRAMIIDSLFFTVAPE
jgi:hypothetical protein